jgi:hypothetical protein
MRKTSFERLIAEKSLARISSLKNEELIEYAIESGEVEPILKNVCTKVTIQLAGEIDEICDLLDISKRKFCEGAFIDAIQKAKKIMEDEGLYDVFNEAFPDDISEDALEALQEARIEEREKQELIREALQ